MSSGQQQQKSQTRPQPAVVQPVSPAPQPQPAGPHPAAALQRTLAAPPSEGQPADIRALQRSLGNQAVQRTLARVAAGPVQREDEGLPVHYEIAPPEETEYFTYRRLDKDGQRVVAEAELARRIAAAESAGHRIIRQRPAGQPDATPSVYEEIPNQAPLWQQFMLAVNGVQVPIRNATQEEIAIIRGALERVPGAHLTIFVARRNRIVVADWTGSQAEGINTHRLSGGANIERTITSEQRSQGFEEESGSRIELTHTSLQDAEAAQLTILHEIGHVAYEANLTPRAVAGTYGSSVHAGVSEQPAYAYAYFLLRPARLQPGDRTAFEESFRRQGLSIPGAEQPAEEEAAAGEESGGAGAGEQSGEAAAGE